MKPAIRLAFKIFKYLLLAYTVVYWIYIVIDDYGFIEKYWATNWAEYLVLWAMYYLVYLIGLSLYFWAIAMATILVYRKLIKPRRKKRTSENVG